MCTLPNKVINRIVARGVGLKVPGDFARGYLGINNMGSYIMEDYLNLLLYYGPVLFGNELEVEVPKMAEIWGYLRAGLVYYARGSTYTEGHIRSPARMVSRARARDSLWKAAELMEEHGPALFMTLNLRLVVVHLYAQEDATGAVDHSLEWWNERCIGQVAKNTPELTCAIPEVVVVNQYLLRERLEGCNVDMHGLYIISGSRALIIRRKERVTLLP